MAIRMKTDYETMWHRIKQAVKDWNGGFESTIPLWRIEQAVRNIEDETPPIRADDDIVTEKAR